MKKILIKTKSKDNGQILYYEEKLNDIKETLQLIEYFRNCEDLKIEDLLIEDVNEERGKQC